MRMIKEGKRENYSGKISNPAKRYFTRLEADDIRDVNRKRYFKDVSNAHNAMIRTCMALHLNWEERQIFRRLQEIIYRHHDHFVGHHVLESHLMDAV